MTAATSWKKCIHKELTAYIFITMGHRSARNKHKNKQKQKQPNCDFAQIAKYQRYTDAYSTTHTECEYILMMYREDRWSTTDDFATSFLHFSLFSTALWDLAESRPVHSLMLPSHLFLCLP